MARVLPDRFIMTKTAQLADTRSSDDIVASARRSIGIEARGIQQLAGALDGPLGAALSRAVHMLQSARGRIIVSGMGKSGQIARKIASTLASTGTPSIFIHPGDASHGDLGMITSQDAVLAFSWSGETPELSDMVAYTRRFSVPLIAVTAQQNSALARSADIVLQLPDHDEACPNGLAPTTSTTLQLVLGDAIAVALLEQKGFTASDFKVLHPGGKLGAALAYVRDIMHSGNSVPVAGQDTPMSDVLVIMTEKSFGCLAVLDPAGRLAGVITDGDLRRHMNGDLLSARARDIMTESPIVIAPDDLASSALELINNSAITALFVVEDGRPVGVVHVHDLLRIGVA